MLQISPNWFLGNWTLDSRSKVGLKIWWKFASVCIWMANSKVEFDLQEIWSPSSFRKTFFCITSHPFFNVVHDLTCDYLSTCFIVFWVIVAYFTKGPILKIPHLENYRLYCLRRANYRGILIFLLLNNNNNNSSNKIFYQK